MASTEWWALFFALWSEGRLGERMIRRIFRFLLTLFLAVLAVVLTLVLVLYFNRGWQRDMVDGALEAQTGMQWSMEEAYFPRPNRFHAKTVYALKGSEGVEAASLDLRIDLGRSLGTNEVVLTSGEIRGLAIDLSQMPAEAFGFSERQLAQGVPTRAETMRAVRNLAEFALMRLEAAGLVVEMEHLAVTGSVILPAKRWLAFDLTILHGRTDATADMRMDIHSAEFR